MYLTGNWNAKGLRSKLTEVKERIQDYDVVTITETKLDDKVTQGSFSVPGYLLIRQEEVWLCTQKRLGVLTRGTKYSSDQLRKALKSL